MFRSSAYNLWVCFLFPDLKLFCLADVKHLPLSLFYSLSHLLRWFYFKGELNGLGSSGTQFVTCFRGFQNKRQGPKYLIIRVSVFLSLDLPVPSCCQIFTVKL